MKIIDLNFFQYLINFILLYIITLATLHTIIIQFPKKVHFPMHIVTIEYNPLNAYTNNFNTLRYLDIILKKYIIIC